MKKYFSIFMLAVMALAFSACSDKDSPDSPDLPSTDKSVKGIPSSTTALSTLKLTQLLAVVPDISELDIEDILLPGLSDDGKENFLEEVLENPATYGLDPTKLMTVGDAGNVVYIIATKAADFSGKNMGDIQYLLMGANDVVLSWSADKDAAKEINNRIATGTGCYDLKQVPLLDKCLSNSNNYPLCAWANVGDSDTQGIISGDLWAYLTIQGQNELKLKVQTNMSGAVADYLKEAYVDPDNDYLHYLSAQDYLASYSGVGKTGTLLTQVLPAETREALNAALGANASGLTISSLNDFGPKAALGMSDGQYASNMPEVTFRIGCKSVEPVNGIISLLNSNPLTKVESAGDNAWYIPAITLIGYNHKLWWDKDIFSLMPLKCLTGYSDNITDNKGVYDLIKNGGAYLDAKQMRESKTLDTFFGMLDLAAGANGKIDWADKKKALYTFEQAWLSFQSKNELEIGVITSDQSAGGLEALFKILSGLLQQ